MAFNFLSRRARQFDDYVSSVDTMLRDPAIATTLGELAAQILVMNSLAYLPNEDHGHLRVPKEYRGGWDRLAIVPVTGRVATHASTFVSEFIDEFSDWIPLLPVETSPVSGYTTSNTALIQNIDAATRKRQAGDTRAAQQTKTNLRESVLARTMVRSETGHLTADPSQRLYRRSRVITVLNNDNVDMHSPWAKTAVAAHEEVHGIDAIHNALLYRSRGGALASELVGHFVTNTLMQSSPLETDVHYNAKRIDDWRQANLGNSFALQDTQVPALEEYLESINLSSQ